MATIIPGIFLPTINPCVRDRGSQHKGLQAFALHSAPYCQDFRSIRLCCSCYRLRELTVSAHEYCKSEYRFIKRSPFLVLLLSFQISYHKFMGGSLFPTVYLVSIHPKTLAPSYLLQCYKSCVIVELNPLTPYLVVTV